MKMRTSHVLPSNYFPGEDTSAFSLELGLKERPITENSLELAKLHSAAITADQPKSVLSLIAENVGVAERRYRDAIYYLQWQERMEWNNEHHRDRDSGRGGGLTKELGKVEGEVDAKLDDLVTSLTEIHPIEPTAKAGPDSYAHVALKSWVPEYTENFAEAAPVLEWLAEQDVYTARCGRTAEEYAERFDALSTPVHETVLRSVANWARVHPLFVAAATGVIEDREGGLAELAGYGLIGSVGFDQVEAAQTAYDEDPALLSDVAILDHGAGHETASSLQYAADLLVQVLQSGGSKTFPEFERSTASRAISRSITVVSAIGRLESAIRDAQDGESSMGGMLHREGLLSVQDAQLALYLPTDWSLARRQIVQFVSEAGAALGANALVLKTIGSLVIDLDDRIVNTSADNPQIGELVSRSLIASGVNVAEVDAFLELRQAAKMALEVRRDAAVRSATHGTTSVLAQASDIAQWADLPDFRSLEVIARAKDVFDIAEHLDKENTAQALVAGGNFVIDVFSALPAELQAKHGMKVLKHIGATASADVVKRTLQGLTLAFSVANLGFAIYDFATGEGSDKGGLISAIGGVYSAAAAFAGVPGLGTAIAGLTLVAGIAYMAARAWWFSDMGDIFERVFEDLGPKQRELMVQTHAVSGAADRLQKLAVQAEQGNLDAFAAKRFEANFAAFQERGVSMIGAFFSMKIFAKDRLAVKMAEPSFLEYVFRPTFARTYADTMVSNESGLNEGSRRYKEFDSRLPKIPEAFNRQMDKVTAKDLYATMKSLSTFGPDDNPKALFESMYGMTQVTGYAFEDLLTVAKSIMSDKSLKTIDSQLEKRERKRNGEKDPSVLNVAHNMHADMESG